MSEAATMCTFIGGTLHGIKQGRMMRGFAMASIVEPIYEPVGKDADRLYKNILQRQIYVRDPSRDAGGVLAYRLDIIETSVRA